MGTVAQLRGIHGLLAVCSSPRPELALSTAVCAHRRTIATEHVDLLHASLGSGRAASLRSPPVQPYYRKAVGAFVVADATRPVTIKGAVKWKTQIDEVVLLPSGARIPVVLLINKARGPALSW